MSEMLKPGDVLDESYEIIEFISKGGFGAVYRARQLSMDRDVALKLLIPGAQPDFEGLVKRFRNEVKAVRNLRHPNTVQIYDFHETHDDQLYFTMEYLDGRSLRELLKSGEAISPKRTTNILAQSLKSLAEAHSTGIIHRDIKPANIMLVDMYGEDDFVKVLDFGIAKGMEEGGPTASEEPLTRTGFLVGTVRYMAPERIAGDAAGPYSDIYSLGLVGASLLVGRPLLGNSSRLEAMQLQMSAKPLPVPDKIMSTALGPVLQRALAKNPKHRYQSAEQMLEDLLAIPDARLEGAPLHITGEIPMTDALGAVSSSGIEPTTVDSEIQSGPSRVSQSSAKPPPRPNQQAGPTGWGQQEAVRSPTSDPRQPSGVTPPLPGSGSGEPLGPDERTQMFESGSTRRPVTSEVADRSSDDLSQPTSRPQPSPRPPNREETESKRVENKDTGNSRVPLYIGLAVVLVGLGAGLTWFLIEERGGADANGTTAGNAASAAEQYVVDLRSDPTGARVLEDGESLGRTPVELQPEEGRRLVVELDGYETRRIELGPDVPPSYTLELTPLDGDSADGALEAPGAADEEPPDETTPTLSFEGDDTAPDSQESGSEGEQDGEPSPSTSDPDPEPKSDDPAPEPESTSQSEPEEQQIQEEAQEVIPVFGSDDGSTSDDRPAPEEQAEDEDEDIPVF
jgi:serine/threonine-protein kinase